MMTACIANGNHRVKPILMKNESPKLDDLYVDPDHLNIVRRGMEAVVNMPGGSAYSHRIFDEDKQMAGKTGTSQVISKKHAKDDLSSNKVVWVNRNHALFIGYAPIHNPKYACAVVVEHGASGAAAAAPLARDILYEAQKAEI
jgi:penicillin-binding protein 2